MAVKQGYATMNWNWHAANGSDSDRAKQVIAQNEARIAELETELETLTKSQSNQLTDMDILDLELASNRANAFDINNSYAALQRIDSRMQNRAKSSLDEAKAQYLKDEQTELKKAELSDKLRQLQVQRAQAKIQTEKEILDSQMENIGFQLEKLGGGKYVPMTYEGKDSRDVLGKYYKMTVNTANGRKFLNDVTEENRAELVQDLLDIGEYEKAGQIEATLTSKEKKEAKQKFETRKKTARAKAESINKVLKETYMKSDPQSVEFRKSAMKAADSLARTESQFVEFKNGKLVPVGKD